VTQALQSTIPLYPYQQQAVERITTTAAPSYLAFEMGLGKTRVALAVAKRKGYRRILVICPAVGRLVWQQEILRVWPDGPPPVIVKSFADIPRLKGDCIGLLSYGLVSASKTGGYDYVDGLKKLGGKFDLTILDEAHALKNATAIRTKGVLGKMLPFLGVVLPMSGTPAPNHAGELFPIIRALWPDTIRLKGGDVMTQFQFEAAFCDVVMKNFGQRQVRVIEGSKNVEQLREKLAPYVIRAKKRDVLTELPPLTFDTLPIQVSGSLSGWTKVIPPGASDQEVLAVLQSKDVHISQLRQATGIAKVPGAVEVIAEALEDSDRKVLVYAHHHAVIDQLFAALAQYSPVKIDGRDNEKARAEAVDLFVNGPNRVFIGQETAAGTSITLVGPKYEVSDVFMVEPSTNPGDNVQAASRIHRIGQPNAVQGWFLTAAGTFDDRVQDILLRRTKDFVDLFH
jgi:SWI/SNF-related matrix-associated actin-dependent regulator 1 of chromatin subfamily A